MDQFLVNVSTPDFSAIVPPISSMPHPKMLPIVSAKDSMDQFVAALDLFREQLSVDKVSELDALTMEQVVKVITVWVSEESEPEFGE